MMLWVTVLVLYIYMGVSKNRGTPKSSILIGFSIINHPFWGTPILETPISFMIIVTSCNFTASVGREVLAAQRAIMDRCRQPRDGATGGPTELHVDPTLKWVTLKNQLWNIDCYANLSLPENKMYPLEPSWFLVMIHSSVQKRMIWWGGSSLGEGTTRQPQPASPMFFRWNDDVPFAEVA